MAKEKDPAFLFYSKDWLEGTAELMPIEKGVFIDLLSHQHQKKGLPTDTERLARLVGLAHDEFLKIWAFIGAKFTEIDGKYVNCKLEKVMSERSEKGKKNTIIGIFSGLLRKSDLSKKAYTLIKKDFNPDDFMRFDSERLSERISEWYLERLKSIEDGNENEDKDEIGLTDKDRYKDKKEFYEIETEYNKEKPLIEPYKEMVKFIFGENPIREPLDKILKAKHQISYENFEELVQIQSKSTKKLRDLLIDINGYSKQYTTLISALKNWFK